MRKDFGSKPCMYPEPVLIVATYNDDGTPNAMNAAWGGIHEDHEVSLCLSPEHKTVKNILKRKAFTVSFATKETLVGADYVGIVSTFNGLTINFWHTFGKTPADAIQAKAELFAKLVKENEGVDVRIQFTYKGAYSDMVGLVNKSFASGETPTIAVAYPDHVADYFAAESTPGQYVVDMSRLANDPEIGFGKEAWLGDTKGAEDFVQAFYEEGTSYSREGLYSLPYMKSSEVMFYNKQLIKKAMTEIGSDYTSDAEIEEYLSEISWDDFMDLCQEIVDANEQGQIAADLLAPAFYDSDGNLIISKIFQNNIGYASISESGKGVIDFNGVASATFTPSEAQTKNYNDLIALMEEMKGQYDNGLFVTKGAYGEYGSNNFVAQKTIFSIGGALTMEVWSIPSLGMLRQFTTTTRPRRKLPSRTEAFRFSMGGLKEFVTSILVLVYSVMRTANLPSSSGRVCQTGARPASCSPSAILERRRYS